MEVVITGGTGFIGRRLVEELLESGHQVTILTRRPELARQLTGRQVRLVEWQAGSGWEQSLDGADAVVNLAGEPIASARWTDAVKERILESRVLATRSLVAAMLAARRKPGLFISGSAVGYYGSCVEPVDETAPAGSDFLAGVCAKWEEAAREAETLGVRVVLLRIGVVLGRGGGALSRLLLPFKLFMGGPIGSGRQPFPWVHLCDVTGLIRFAIKHEQTAGPVNAVAPELCTNAEFCRELGRVLRRPCWLPVPAFLLSLALGEMAEAMLLSGQAVVPAAAERLGYAFRFARLSEALAEAAGR